MINTSSARTAITMAMASGWRSPELTIRVDTSSKGDTTPQILHGLDAGRIIKAVEEVPDPARSWLYLAYAPPGWVTEAHAWRVQEELVSAYHQVRKVREPGKIAVLALVCLGDMRDRLSRGAAKLSPSVIARKVRVDPRNWPHGWAENYETMEAIIDGWDREGLGPIAESLPRFTREAMEAEREQRKAEKRKKKQAVA